MQSPTSPEEDPSGGFGGGGWAADYWSEVMEQVQQEAMSEPYDLLLGRATYQMFAAHNMAAEDANPISTMMNNARKYVVSNTLSELDWQNSVLLNGNIPEQIAALKTEEGPLLQVHGSAGLVQTLLEYGLIDEFRLWTFPVLVGGNGKKLFASGTKPENLKLIKAAKTTNGVSMEIYER